MKTTVVVREVAPPGPVARRVYVVVRVGWTVTLPFVGTVPTEGWMVQVDAWAVLQERVTASPAYLGMAGEAVNAEIWGKW
jgi:hypothetical protein